MTSHKVHATIGLTALALVIGTQLPTHNTLIFFALGVSAAAFGVLIGNLVDAVIHYLNRNDYY